MRTFLLATCVAVLSAAPALANPYQIRSPNSSQVYGDGSAAATGGRAKATGGASTSYGSSVTVNNNNSYPAQGGASSAGQGAAAANPSGYASGVHVDARQAPDVVVPSIGGGGADCPVVGFGLGGSGLGGGGGFGPAWISGDCNTRKLAAMLEHMGRSDAALALLEDRFPEVKRAMEATNQPNVVNASDEVVQPVGADSYCSNLNSYAERRRHPECKRGR